MTKPKITKRPQSPRGERARRRRRPAPPLAITPAFVILTTTTCIFITITSSPQHHHLPFFATAAPADCNPCEGRSAGFVQVPDTECGEFVQCASGEMSQKFDCQGGLIYDATLSQCNWEWSATCGPDPVCPTPAPTAPVRTTPAPTTAKPTLKPTVEIEPLTPSPVTFAPTQEGNRLAPPSLPDVGTLPDAPPPSTSTPIVPLPAQPENILEPPPAAGLEPVRLEHHAGVWAHLNANKIGISNQLLRVAQRQLSSVYGNNLRADELRNYAYYDFYNSLRSMIEEGYAVPVGEDQVDAAGNPLLARSVFYLGDPSLVDAAAVGLINVAAFLSQALAESISTGSCDELNQEMVGGYLPISNSCGQHGLSYQDMHCSDEEKFMECSVDASMEMYANPSGRPVSPFYCGPAEKYPFTGTANYISGRVPVDSPVPNVNGRTDVEGCCWWGRGAVNTRGICQYGKLNYYLGARAAREGRPSRYPHIDFCANPQTICSTQQQDSDIEWVSGLFRWIDAVQSYQSYGDDGEAGWNYIQKLHEFVAGGMTDELFIHSVSAIVTQGCHEAPCPGVADAGVETTTDAAKRWSYFLQVLDVLGLPVKTLQ